MPNATPRLALNIPLIVLWVVSIGVGAIGFWQLRAGNTAQADFYNTGGSDYLTYLDLQTQSTIGGFLLVAGIIGVLIALATHARNRAAAIVAASTAAAAGAAVDDADEFEDLEDTFIEETDAAGVEPAAEAAVEALPAEEAATEASTAVTATETPGPDAEASGTPEAEASDAPEAEPEATDTDDTPTR